MAPKGKTKRALEHVPDEDAFERFVGWIMLSEAQPEQRARISLPFARICFTAGWREAMLAIGIKPKRKMAGRANPSGAKRSWPMCAKCGNAINTADHRAHRKAEKAAAAKEESEE